MKLIDRYILSETSRRLLIALGVVLAALLLERVLRLVEFTADHDGSFDLAFRMAMNLLPHYLGLALPAGFFISIFLMVSRLGEDSELEAMLGCGMPLRRIAQPLILLSVLLALVTLLLYGYAQPYSRYAYRSIRHIAASSTWTGTLPQDTFVTIEDRLTVLADEVTPGWRLRGVFVHRTEPDGGETVITATRGRLVAGDNRSQLRLVLEDGVEVAVAGDGTSKTLHFNQLDLTRAFDLAPPPFRPRGEDEREMTLHELWQAAPADPVLANRQKAELHARLARAMSMTVMPLLAVPLGVAAKRGRRGKGIALAAVVLVVYHHLLQFGEGLIGLGKVGPAVALWLPLVVFALACALLFQRANRAVGLNPLDALFERVDDVFRAVGRLWPWQRHSA